MNGAADRMARVARIRSLQKRQALAGEARAAQEAGQLRDMAGRIDKLRHVYSPAEGEADGFSLKSVIHQYDRLGLALATTRDRQQNAEQALAQAKTRTLEAHMRKRAADELAARAEAREAKEKDHRAERNMPPRRR